MDANRLKAGGHYCRYAFGDRNKAFPLCCPSVRCKQMVNGKMTPLPEHMYPDVELES